jgi:hypothetical protein
MKKVFCMSFLLFATTLCFSATTGNTDKVAKSVNLILLPTATSELPFPVAGCSKPPQFCPDPPNPPVQ